MSQGNNPFQEVSEASLVEPAAPTSEERTLAMLCHLLGLFTGFLGPLILWLIKKEESDMGDDQGKEALNFQLTLLIAFFVCIPLVFLIIGVPLFFVVTIYGFIYAIIAAVRANEGEYYRYPVCIRLIK